MKAVEFKVSIPGFLLARSLGRFAEVFLYGRLSGLRLRRRSEAQIPGPDWARIEVLLCGICGSDVGNVGYRSSPAMEPFGSFPAVLGHEVVGRVLEVGPEVVHVGVGDRVVVDPMLNCVARGHVPEPGLGCRSCAGGWHATCEMAGEEGQLRIDGQPLAPGLTIGYHRDLPGGWGEQMIVHRSQLFRVPETLDDRVAVLAEPFSIGMHGVLGSGVLSDSGPVLVIGSGAISFATIWALRTLGFTGKVVAQAKRPHEVALALEMGADETVTPGAEARDALVSTGARAYMPLVGDEVYAGGGFATVFDCVGNRSSLSQALRYASARGQVVVLGCAGQVAKLDLTALWAKELCVRGFVGYGTEEWGERHLHTFELTLERMAADPRALDQVVTHIFPLDQYRDGLRAAFNHGRSKAIKVVLRP